MRNSIAHAGAGSGSTTGNAAEESASRRVDLLLMLIDHPFFSVAMTFGLSKRTKTVQQRLQIPIYSNSSRGE